MYFLLYLICHMLLSPSIFKIISTGIRYKITGRYNDTPPRVQHDTKPLLGILPY